MRTKRVNYYHDYGYMVRHDAKHVGLWWVELVQNRDTGTWQIILTRATDCLYDVKSFDDEATCRKAYKELKRVKQIMNYVRLSQDWFI